MSDPNERYLAAQMQQLEILLSRPTDVLEKINTYVTQQTAQLNAYKELLLVNISDGQRALAVKVIAHCEKALASAREASAIITMSRIQDEVNDRSNRDN